MENFSQNYGLKFVVPVERLAKVGDLGADEHIVFVQNFVSRQHSVLVAVRFCDEVLGLGTRMVVIGGNYPGPNLKKRP